MKPKTGALAVVGSILTAVIASACCWLPLLLVAFGVSATGISAKFDAVRPYFLVLTVVLLGAGFYFSYFRKQRCEPGGACEKPKPALQRWNRAMLWLATVVVAAVGFFPSYVGLISATGEVDVPPAVAALPRTELRIEGMTCEACATNVRNQLLTVGNVAEATVRYPDGTAIVFFNAGAPPQRNALVEAVARAGYVLAPN